MTGARTDPRVGLDPGPRPLRTAHLLVLALGTFTLGIDSYVLAGLLPEVAADLEVSISTAGQLTAVFAVAYAVGSPIIAASTGGWDRRVLLAGGAVVFIVGMIAQAAGPDFATVAAGRVIAALGAAAYQANAFATAGLLSTDRGRARALAVVGAGNSLALVVGLPFGILVGQLWGWRETLWILAALTVITVFAVGLLPAVHAPSPGLRERVLVLADRRVLGILFGTVTVMMPGYLILSYVPTILDASGMLVVAAMLAFGGGQVLGTTVVPWLIGRRGAPSVLVLAAAGSTASALLLAVTRTDTVAAVLTLCALGLSVGIALVPQQHRLFALVPAHAPVAMGLNGSTVYLAVALGAGLGGAALAGIGPVAAAPVAALIGVGAVAVGIVVRPERIRSITAPVGSPPPG